MLFENLQISRLVIHEVFKRSYDREVIPPQYGAGLVQLNQEAKDALRERVLDAVGSASKSMEMEFTTVGTNSTVALAQHLLAATDHDYIERSKQLADALAVAQKTMNLPGGILVVCAGTVGYPLKKVLILIKAEPHSGFRRTMMNGQVGLAYLKDLILTPQAKLYKIGAFIEFDTQAAEQGPLPSGWRAIVYDDAMTATNRYGAAQYFYEGFLGLKFPQDSARLTRDFYEHTKSFISNLDIPEEQKIDLYTGLYSYLKVEQSPVVEVAAFANQFMETPSMRDVYRDYMQAHHFPVTAVPKDLANIAESLKQRRVQFGNNIRLIAEAEAFNEKIQIEPVDGPLVDGTTPPKWTQVLIKEQIKA